MKYTPNYELKKPEQDDFYNVEDFNENADIIDQALKAHDDALATKETTAGAQDKASTAEANAKAYTDAHEQKAAPHSGHETPAGAQDKAAAAAAAAVAAHDTNVAAHGGIYRKNLLHNWYFRNPVNQRGFTSTTAAGYTIDRWMAVAAGHTVELTPNGLKLTASSGAGLNNCFAQYIENYENFEGKTLTLSVHVVENTLTQGCNLRWNANASPAIMGTGYFSTTFTPSSLSYLQIGLQFANRNVDDGKYVIIDKMKLEIGNVSTLANDPPAIYSEQLAFCGPVVDTIAPTNYIGQDGQWQVY